MKRVIRAVTLMIMGVCFFSILFHYQSIFKLWQKIQTDYIILLDQSEIQNSIISGSESNENLKKLYEKIALIHYDNVGKIENEEFSRTANPYILQVSGSSSIVFPDTFLPTEEDECACLIDHETAISLFGSSNVTGKQITYKGRSYYIYGIVKCHFPIFVYVSDSDTGKEENFCYQAAIVKATSKQDMQEMKKQLKLYFGIDGKTYPLWKFEVLNLIL